MIDGRATKRIGTAFAVLAALSFTISSAQAQDAGTKPASSDPPGAVAPATTDPPAATSAPPADGAATTKVDSTSGASKPGAKPSGKGAKADPALAFIQKSYSAGKYKDALDKIATMKPSDTTHYWTGLCYQGQGQLRQAIPEYQWVLVYSKNERLKADAQTALRGLSRYGKRRGSFTGPSAYTGDPTQFSKYQSYSSVEKGGGSALVPMEQLERRVEQKNEQIRKSPEFDGDRFAPIKDW